MKHILKYNKKSYEYVEERGPSIAIGDVVVLSSSKKDDVYIAKRSETSGCDTRCPVGMRRCVHYYFECPSYTCLEKIDDIMENL